MSLGFPVWFSSMMIHFVFAERLACHVEANPVDRTPPKQKCALLQANYDSVLEWANACGELEDVEEEKAVAAAAASAVDEDEG